MANPRPSTELPSEVLAQLDPTLRELHSKLHPEVASRISFLMREARGQGIHPNRVLKFAFLYASAERLARGESISKEHTRRAKLELAGQIHGLRSGYEDEAEAKKRYRNGRQARQRMESSVEAVVRQWRVFEQVVQKHRADLPVHVQTAFSDAILREVGQVFKNMRTAVRVDEEDVTSGKGLPRERSEIAQTYIWWRLKVPMYRGKWKDMHQLAFVWRMSPSGSVQSFRTVVERICKNVTELHAFAKDWESVVSEN